MDRVGTSLICSYRSNQMRDCERFTQIAQDKWATVSKLLRSLMSKERLWGNSSGHSWQMSGSERFAQVAHVKWANEQFTQIIWLKSYFLVRFFNQWFTHSLFFNEQCERIAQVAHQKWAMGANRSGCSPKMSNHERFAQVAHQTKANERIAHLFAKFERFAQKFPTLFMDPSLLPALSVFVPFNCCC